MGGMQRVSLQLVEVLESNSNVELETLMLEAEWGNIGLKTTFFLLDLLVKVPEIVERKKIDVILFSSMVTASLAPFIRRSVCVPMVTINHGHDVTLSIKMYQLFLKSVFRALDGVISVSEATRSASIVRGLHPDKGISLPNGMSIDKVNKDVGDKTSAKKRLESIIGKDLNGKYILLTAGRLIRRKGHAWFIEHVLPEIKSNVEYIILGSGPEMPTIQNLLKRSKIAKKVSILGRQPDDVLQDSYQAADIFVMPNIVVPGDMEGFGVVMLEANLMETPVVATDLEGIKDVIKPHINGYKIDVGNALKFAGCIDNIINTELDTLSKSAKEYVLENFAWEQVSLRYLQYLNEVINNYKRRELLSIT
jgi:phosphatidylinositol alpha-1,6-mannosyltransferase